MANSKFEAGVLRELTCQICYEYMLPPIKLCESGHNICNNCFPKLQTCGLCRKGILQVRNISLENLAREVHFPCKNSDAGCPVLVTYADLKSHHAQCCHGNHRCPFARISKVRCDWCGRISEMIKHIAEAHSSSTEVLTAGSDIQFQFNKFSSSTEKIPTAKVLSTSSSVNVSPYSFGKHPVANAPIFGLSNLQPTSSTGPTDGSPKSASQAILALDELFYVVFSLEPGKLRCSVLYVGGKEEASQFMYKFSLSSKRESVTFSLATPCFMNEAAIFEDENCVTISGYSRFLENDKLKPKIEILKYEDTKEDEEIKITKMPAKVKDLTFEDN